jgi:hypothetical protein
MKISGQASFTYGINKNMKNLLVALLCAIPLLSGCQSMGAMLENMRQYDAAKHNFNAPLDKVYPATVQALVEKNCAIKQSQKDSGLIETQCPFPRTLWSPKELELFQNVDKYKDPKEYSAERIFTASFLVIENADGSCRIDIRNEKGVLSEKVDREIRTREVKDFEKPDWDSILSRVHEKLGECWKGNTFTKC